MSDEAPAAERELARGEVVAHEEQVATLQAELDELSGERTDNAWGSQIRSYVLAPYQLVKDLRTNVEIGNTQGVLDGNLDDFIAASLKQGV